MINLIRLIGRLSDFSLDFCSRNKSLKILRIPCTFQSTDIEPMRYKTKKLPACSSNTQMPAHADHRLRSRSAFRKVGSTYMKFRTGWVNMLSYVFAQAQCRLSMRGYGSVTDTRTQMCTGLGSTVGGRSD